MAGDDSQDESSKTEEPTQKRLEEARKKGQVVQSRELNHFFMMLALTALIMIFAPNIMHQTITYFEHFITAPDEINVTGSALSSLALQVVTDFAFVLLLPLLICVAAALAPAIVQNKLFFAAENIKPKLEKISPMKGFKRIFGGKAWVEFIKNLLKVIIVGLIAWYAVEPLQAEFKTAMDMTMVGILEISQHLGSRVMIGITVFLFLLAIFDYLYQRFSFMKSMRMSKQELKDEYKQSEGDPHVRQRQKQLRREKAKKRMMSNVPTADVIITNPTHYAVALKYDQATMTAPHVVAMGVDKVALRIREMAEKAKVPIVRNPPLARVLYSTAELDEEIPLEHYAAVAKIIGYVYRLKGKQAPAKVQKLDPGKKKGLTQKNK
jgi:flagellar biosynthesis protein FlhB